MNNQLDFKNILKLEFLSGNNFHLISRKSIVKTRLGSLDHHRHDYYRILSKTSNARARALIHSLSSFITADSRERNGKGVSGETVDGVKERDDESGQPETMSYRRQAFAARLSRLVSRFQFRVSSSFPRRLITASFSSLRETSNDQTNFHTLKGRRCLLPEAISPSFPFFLRLNVEDRSP